jgi:hypothetical protein
MRRFADEVGTSYAVCAEHRNVATAWCHVMVTPDDDFVNGHDVTLEWFHQPTLPWTLHRQTRGRDDRAVVLAAFAQRCQSAGVRPTKSVLTEWLRAVDAGEADATVRPEPTPEARQAAPQAAQEPSVPSTRPHTPITPNVAPIARLVATLESQWERQGCPHDADLAAQLRRLASLMDVTS